jgi:uncharacterized YigZ family protein
MSAEDTYLTIESLSQGIYKEKGSKFIALAKPVRSEEEVKEFLKSLRKEYHDARHHCYAYCLGPDQSVYRINDDGEPSGTAGRPIYGQLLSRNLTQLVVVVIRYFGGIKLGVPGLINAYKQATADALDHAIVVTRTVVEQYLVGFDYATMNQVMKILKEENAAINDQYFENQSFIKFTIRKSLGKKICSRLEKVNNVSVDLQGEF